MKFLMGNEYSMHNPLKIERLRKRMPQKELAVLSGVNQTMISMLELGYKKDPSASIKRKLAKALQVEESVIFPTFPEE